MNPFDDDDSEVDEEQLSELLNSMDIDKDFQCWTSFRSSMRRSMRNSGGAMGSGAPNPFSPEEDAAEAAREAVVEQQDIHKWEHRVQRTEVYSTRYRPSAKEQKELQELSTFLGMSSFVSPKSSSKKPLFKRLVLGGSQRSTDCSEEEGMSSESLQTWRKLTQPGKSNSILLKRGPVLWLSLIHI